MGGREPDWLLVDKTSTMTKVLVVFVLKFFCNQSPAKFVSSWTSYHTSHWNSECSSSHLNLLVSKLLLNTCRVHQMGVSLKEVMDELQRQNAPRWSRVRCPFQGSSFPGAGGWNQGARHELTHSFIPLRWSLRTFYIRKSICWSSELERD